MNVEDTVWKINIEKEYEVDVIAFIYMIGFKFITNRNP